MRIPLNEVRLAACRQAWGETTARAAVMLHLRHPVPRLPPQAAAGRRARHAAQASPLAVPAAVLDAALAEG